VIVQIYEVSTPAEARALGAMKVDHIGVLVGEGSFPREQTIEKAREIFAAIPSGIKRPRCRFLTTWISLCGSPPR
jgi:phosphoribosylanthranilate isomerase